MAIFEDATGEEQRSYKNIPYIWYTKPGGWAWEIKIFGGWSSGWWDSEHDAIWELRQYIDSHLN